MSTSDIPITHAKPMIKLIVMDFDDTLYDWIGHFMPALDAMIRAGAPLLGVTEDTLRKQLKVVHEYYGNTEQPFALLETTAAQQCLGSLPWEEQRHALASAFDAFDEIRAKKLKLYDDVQPALAKLRKEGIAIVGYSAAPSVNIAKRVKMLDLAHFFDRIYASPFVGKPFPGHRPPLDQTVPVIELHQPKPDPDAVQYITRDLGVISMHTLFVGDSLAADIAPAIAGGAQAALVRRETTSTDTLLPDLLKVSHRTAETRADSGALSDAELARVPVLGSLADLWSYFSFAPTTVDTLV